MKRTLNIHRNQNLTFLTILILTLSLNGCSYDYIKISRDIKEIYPGQPEGYLKSTYMPNSETLLPLPPQPGSAALENDIEISNNSLMSNDSLRWEQAQIDANLDFPFSIDAFTQILDKRISVETTPYLYLLLQRVIADASVSTHSAKVYYKRQRPFMINNRPTCDPESESFLKDNGSYPSGHTAIGWAWALILTEIFPDQTNKILQRGREFGESRIICNVHWYSDVVEGRFMGAAIVSALHGNDEFQHDLKKAKQEIKRIK